MKRFALAVVFQFGFASPVWADFQAGVAAYERGDYETAHIEFLILAVPGNNARAQFYLYLIADKRGDADAPYMLGWIYEIGRGVPQDYAEAVKWYRKGAEQGDDLAQDNLARMYYKGHGVPQNYVQVHMWWNLAAAQGHKYAAKNRAMVSAKVTAAQIAEAQRLAWDWKPKMQ